MKIESQKFQRELPNVAVPLRLISQHLGIECANNLLSVCQEKLIQQPSKTIVQSRDYQVIRMADNKLYCKERDQMKHSTHEGKTDIQKHHAEIFQGKWTH